MNDRDALLRDLTSLVSGRVKDTPSEDERLSGWHRATKARYLKLLDNAVMQWPVLLKENHCQMSYLISAEAGEALQSGSLRSVLEEVNNEVRNVVWTGWSMFYSFNRPEIMSAIHPEFEDGSGMDVLETNLMGNGEFGTSLPDFWRFAIDGRASIVRAYREDRPRTVKALSRPAGTWLSPVTVVRETAEFVAHARLAARRFQTATHVSFRYSWTGLEGRYLDDFDPGIGWSSGRVSKAEGRTTEGKWTTAALAGTWASVVADLSCPVLNLFGLDYCGPAFVAGLAPRFRTV